MSEPRATYNLSTRIRGDSWRGIESIEIEVNSAPPPVAAASARMFFRENFDSPDTVLELSTSDGTITITNAAAWTFVIPEILDFPLRAGTWVYDFETTDTAGFVRTYFGGTIKIWRDVSR
jgi:hypothetical protein